MTTGLMTWYGGKARMAPTLAKIIESIPHSCYAEAFAGGASVFFSLPIKKHAYINGKRFDMTYALNDKSVFCVNVYRCARAYPEEFQDMCYYTLHSLADFGKALEILRTTELQYNSPPHLEAAWAMFVVAMQSFGSIPAVQMGSWGKSRKTSTSVTRFRSRVQAMPKYFEHLRYASIDCVDALDFIKRWDSPNTLFFCDPPYVGTDMRKYNVLYTVEEYKALCHALDTCQGSYVLTNYNYDIRPQSATRIIEYENINSMDNRIPQKKVTEYIFIRDRSSGSTS